MIITNKWIKGQEENFTPSKSGVKWIFTDDDLGRDKILPGCKLYRSSGQKGWTNAVVKVLKTLKPDVVVCDWQTIAGLEGADKCGVPCIVNMPSSLETFNALGYYLPHRSRLQVISGMMCLRPKKEDALAQEAMD